MFFKEKMIFSQDGSLEFFASESIRAVMIKSPKDRNNNSHSDNEEKFQKCLN